METREKIVKIAVVGPESTGKSTMSQLLAEHYHTVWVPEYAREYCSKLTDPCGWQDEINMFYGQMELEERLMADANKLLICDTTFLTVKIWSDYMFGKTPEEVLEMLPKHTYDLYLLLDIDLPWEDDPLRDFPHLRGYFMEVWHNELAALHARYTVISGDTDERVQNAIKAVNNYLNII